MERIVDEMEGKKAGEEGNPEKKERALAPEAGREKATGAAAACAGNAGEIAWIQGLGAE